MAANVPPQPPEETPAATAECTPMNWVMVLWLVCFLTVVVFGVVSYLFGWWFTKG